MAKQAIGITHRDIVDQIRKREFAPIYFLMGDESYYIDRVSEYFADNVLPEAERDFNQQIIYCTKETAVGDIINSARRYPMMSEHQLVIVKEAQNLLKIEELTIYAQNPLKTTILVICYKNGSYDRRKKLIPAIEKVGVVFESKKLKDSALPGFISDYLKRKKITINQQATMMLVDYIGADLNRLSGELDKLVITLPSGTTQIDADLIEKNIGISKEFNVWELRSAIVSKNVLKANRIINYFNSNAKANPPVMTITTLYNFFANLMLAYYSPEKTTQGMLEQLELKSEWQLKEYTQAMRNYSAMKTMQIIGKIRETDGKLKGIRKGNITDADLMKELLYFILH